MGDADLVQIVERAADDLGAYLHVPFCEAVCPYCDFAVVAGRDDEVSRYLKAVTAEINGSDAVGLVDAVFVGGGTPSRVSGLAGLVGALEERHGLAPDAEVTLEANPEDWTDGKAEELRTAGFTRVSFGAQSYDPMVLEYLGRRHSPNQIDAAVDSVRRTGFESVSIDLIFGSPVESDASWERTLGRALEASPDHVSTYALTVERGTELSRLVIGGAPAPDPDVQAGRYEIAQAILQDAGYRRYEVSNYARPGHECRYNLIAWAQGEYLAFGMGAHGHLDGVRFRNVRKLDAYLDAVERGVSPRAGQESIMTGDPGLGNALDEERVVLGLRRSSGVVLDDVATAFMASSAGIRLVEAGVITAREGRLVILKPLLTDEVCSSFLASRS
ncbi:MAG: radical SAM family heme chaperone HemW [Acidimicrobiia bacterium]|nr:radical SAM family heme chaperone HemW [Acidimicrobiia bacterium]NNL26824.1 radical SAM family heme chaperone HemW [Acidimicrobiia bacterium]